MRLIHDIRKKTRRLRASSSCTPHTIVLTVPDYYGTTIVNDRRKGVRKFPVGTDSPSRPLQVPRQTNFSTGGTALRGKA